MKVMIGNKTKRERVDHLIDHLWSNGYLTLSRKFGKYLPAPTPLGNYEVDAIAKYKRKIAIGLTVSEDDLEDPNFISKLRYITHEKSKFPNSRITLFLGVPNHLFLKAHMLVASLDEETRSSIKIVNLPDSGKESANI
jgi:hypothetical protein